MKGSWIDRLRRWLQKESPSSDRFDPRTFDQLCREDPASARAALVADQRSLSEELERTYTAYEERLEAVSSRLRTLSPEDIEREARVLREAQDGLRRLIHRIEASAKTARDLERELHEWERRGDEEGPWHADHPLVRAEVVRSELASRGDIRRIFAIPPEQSPFRVASVPEVAPEEEEEAPQPRVIAFGRYEEPATAREPLHSPDPEHLLHVIRLETREAERWHGHHESDPEAIVQLRHLRDLHAALKRIDRERGIRRDRMAYAVHMREVH